MAWTFTTLKTAIQDYTDNSETTFVTSSNTVHYLIPKDVNFMHESFPTTTTTGRPEYYAVFDANNFILGPTPDATYDAEIHYLKKPTSITTGSATWLGTNATDALLYGSLVEAYTFMKGEPDILAEYKERFNQAISRLKNLGEGRLTKDQYRNGKLRIQES